MQKNDKDLSIDREQLQKNSPADTSLEVEKTAKEWRAPDMPALSPTAQDEPTEDGKNTQYVDDDFDFTQMFEHEADVIAGRELKEEDPGKKARRDEKEQRQKRRERRRKKARQKKRRSRILFGERILLCAVLFLGIMALLILSAAGLKKRSGTQEEMEEALEEALSDENLSEALDEALDAAESTEESLEEEAAEAAKEDSGTEVVSVLSEEEIGDDGQSQEIVSGEVTSVPFYGTFELPLSGTSGYASASMSVYDDDGEKIATLSGGEAFVILAQDGNYFNIEMSDGTLGRVETAYTWVNLPDLIPSIVYYDVNSDASIFVSSGYDLPGITGQSLYNSLFENERLGEEQYVMPVLYSMAHKIMAIQQACLANGESLKIYQTFRPYDTQMEVAEALQELESSNDEVRAALNSGSWSDSWYIAMKLSNHQRGCAIDTSLVKVEEMEERTCAGYSYQVITEYSEYEMPSKLHELSPVAAVYDPPVSGSSDTAWRSATLADTMNEAAIRLQEYSTDYGLTPLSSEWWHFNDLEAKSLSAGNAGKGQFYLTECLSRIPSGDAGTTASEEELEETAERASIDGVITWEDDEDSAGLRPASIKVQLAANGSVVAASLASDINGYSFLFGNFPLVDEEGVEIVYTLLQQEQEGYTFSGGEAIVTEDGITFSAVYTLSDG